jgi:hypothetical protein
MITVLVWVIKTNSVDRMYGYRYIEEEVNVQVHSPKDGDLNVGIVRDINVGTVIDIDVEGALRICLWIMKAKKL